MASQITGVSIICSNICSGADQRKHQSSTSLAFVRGIHQWAADTPHKRPVMQKMFSFDDIIMRDEITYPFPNSNSAGDEVWERIINSIPRWACGYLSMLGLKSNPVSINGPRRKLDVLPLLTHWGRVTHICVNNVTIIGSDNGLLPVRCQAIIWTNAGVLLIWPLGTNFDEILIEIRHFHWRKYVWKCCLWNVAHFTSASMCEEAVHQVARSAMFI